METVLQDLKFGVKLLWKEKAFALTVLITLAVCIGANTTIFSVVNTVLLDPLPFYESDRLVRVFNSYPNAGAERASNSSADYFFRRERVEAFEEVAVYQNWGHTVGEPGSTERMNTMRVTPSFFPMLGVQPVVGRTFTEDEMDVGSEQKVVLSYGFWRERFGGDPAAVGQNLRVDGRPYAIVGVLGEEFRFLGQRESRFYVPIPFTEEQRTPASLHSNNYEMIARLAPEATIEQAVSQIEALDLALAPEVPFPNYLQMMEDVGYHVEVHDLKDDLLRDIRPTFIMLWVGVAFVLLIGCLNIANLMLARSNVRMKELATRMALGSDRGRLARQLLTEAVLTALLGAVLGLGLGAAGLSLVAGMGVDDLPRGTQVGIDGGVLLFTLAIAVVAGIFFGAIPLAHVFRSDLSTVFRSESRSGTANRRMVFLRSAMVTGQVAIAFILLIGAGLMLASLRSALSVDPGFRPNSVLTGYLSLPESNYPDGDSRRQFIDEMLRDVRALPGVTAASITTQIPFGGGGSATVIMPEGYLPREGESVLAPFSTTGGPGYFEALAIPLIAGRYFDESDNQDAQQVIVIDQWLAERFYPDESPLGKRMLWSTLPGMEENEEDFLYTIIGVVGSIKQNDLTEAEQVGAYYFSYKQRAPSFMTLTVRTAVEPITLTAPIRQAVARIDPDLPFYYPETLEHRVSESLVTRRTPMVLLAGFAGVALLLAAVGIYGILAYSVTQRTREIGIRMALGSSPGEVSRLVVFQGAKVLGLGLVIGLGGSVMLVRLIQSLLYGVEPTDPTVLLTVAVMLTAVGIGACLVPARRATRIDPTVALNTE
ncbi:MAG: ABC transporter permease [Gemmatimonadota bacterium]|nr:MAG: ABC transporter permease [Gemmatimonadota bacterium]